MISTQGLDSLLVKIKPDNKDYVITAEALAINGLDILKHDAEGMSRKDAEKVIKRFIKKWATVGVDTLDNGKKKPVIEKLIPVGHFVQGDLDRIRENFPESSWSIYVSHGSLDTLTIGRFKQHTGSLPPGIKMGLQHIVARVLPDHKFIPHRADEDARASGLLLGSWIREESSNVD